MIAIPASLRSDFIHIPGTLIHIALESTIHITGIGTRSVYNKFENVMTFLKAQGIRGLVGNNDWPRFVEEEPEVYEKEELDKLFKACDPDEQLWYEFFLMTGMREQEVMHASRSDVNPTSRRGHYGRASICAPCSSGSAIRIWNPRCAI